MPSRAFPFPPSYSISSLILTVLSHPVQRPPPTALRARTAQLQSTNGLPATPRMKC